MARQKTAAEKRTFEQLDTLIEAAKVWGWQEDQGVGASVTNAENHFREAKQAMESRLKRLHADLRTAQRKNKQLNNENP